MTNDSSASENPVEILAAEFVERRRRGERPSIEEYVGRHPELADQIRAFFPALALVEELRPGSDDATGSFAAARSAGVAPPPERLGDFRILREVGRGGMGVVYEAEQESLGRRVALKVLGTPTLLDPQKLRRFHREARAAANLHHTHIVPVFGVGEEEGLHYYVMQLIPGLSLNEVIDELRRLRAEAGDIPDGPPIPGPGDVVSAAGVAHSLWSGRFPSQATTATLEPASPAPQSPAQGDARRDSSSSVSLPGEADLSAATDSARRYVRSVARIGEQVAEALEYAHTQGTLHRDIKPSNLLLDPHGTVWVTDFGLAKATDDDDLTHTGDILGTVRYMAPERFRGRCDARSDVYALGLTLYELLALRPAFRGVDRHDLIRRITQEEPPRLRQLDPAIPRDLETIVHKAIEKDPADRYATAAALAEDLRRFLDDRPIRARRASATEQLVRWARRNKALAASMSAVGLLLLTFAAGSTLAALWYQRVAKREAELYEGAREQNENLLRKDYVYRLALADREIDAGNLGAALDYLDGCPEEYRDRFEYRYVLRRAHLDIPRFAGVRGDAVDLAYSPDGKWLFSAEGVMYSPWSTAQATLVKRDAETGAILGRLAVDGSIRSIDVSADGRWLVIGTGYHLQGPPMSSGGEVILVEARTLGRCWRHPAPGPWWANSVAISPDGRSVLVGYGSNDSPSEVKSGAAEVLDRATGDAIRTFPGLGPEAIGFGVVAFHPDGRTVALGSFEQIALYDLEAEGPAELINTSQRGNLFALAFSPDGRYLASAGWGRTINLWDVETRRLLRHLDDHQGFVRALAFSPNGRSLASAGEDQSVRLWDVETGEPIAVFHGHAFHAVSVAWHPDGLLLASGGADKRIRLWDVRTSRPIVLWHHGWANALAFDPNPGHDVLATQGFGDMSHDRYQLWNPITGENLVDSAPWDPIAVPSFSEAVRARGLEPATGPQFSFVSAVALSADGQFIATLDRLTTIKVRERATGALSRTFESPGVVIVDLEFTPDGKSLVSGEVSPDLTGTVVCWDLESGRERWRVVQGRWVGFDLAVSPDGRSIAVAGGVEGRLVLLDVVGGDVVAELASDPNLSFTSCAFNADGTRLALGCSERNHGSSLVRVFDISEGSGRERFRLTGHTSMVTDLAFSPDSSRLASASFDRTVKLWDTARGEEVFTFRGHTQGVLCVAFNPNGDLLASGSNDFTVRVWDARPVDRAAPHADQSVQPRGSTLRMP